MTAEALVVRELMAGDEQAFRDAIDEFARSEPDWDFAFCFDDVTDFGGYVERLQGWPQGHGLPGAWVPNSYLVAVVGSRIVGRLSIRHELNEFLLGYAGHIGFGVVPSARRRGYGTAILQRSLPLARAAGVERALVTCDEQNIGSRTIIESCGGVLEDRRPRDGGGTTLRFWIEL